MKTFVHLGAMILMRKMKMLSSAVVVAEIIWLSSSYYLLATRRSRLTDGSVLKLHTHNAHADAIEDAITRVRFSTCDECRRSADYLDAVLCIVAHICLLCGGDRAPIV